MHINYNDPILWLHYRYPCDAAARHADIERKFLTYFEHIHRLHIVDIGAGTGANFRYYFSRLQQSQAWTLVEQNDHLVRASQICLEKFATDHGYGFRREGKYLMITDKDKAARISIVQGTLDHIEQQVDLQKVDVLTANAVFDLISYEQFDHLACKLAACEVCLLATLNYYETSFLPFSSSDYQFLRFYHMHMKRPQPFGIAMGADCSEEMLDLLRQHDLSVAQGPSQWHLSRNHTTLHHYLLHFIENAIDELNLTGEEHQAFHTWFAEKRNLSDQRRLDILVDHSDIFACPD